MPKIEIDSQGVRGTVTVDGVKLPGVIGCRVELGVQRLPVVMLELAAMEQRVAISEGVLRINGVKMPEAVERALLAHLSEKHGAPLTEVTTMDDEGQRFARVAPLTRWEPGTPWPGQIDPASVR